MPDTRGPHDAFFKESFSRPEMAAGLLQNYAPATLTARLDLESLRASKDSFVDPDLKASHSDLLFTARLRDGGSALVYLLFEHKSRPETLVAVQLLGYILRIWQRGREEGARLPTIVPVVVYHGAAAWAAPRRLIELVELPEPGLSRFVPDFGYELIDLSHLREEEIQGAIMLRVAVHTLRVATSEDPEARLPGLRRLLGELSQARTGMAYLHTVLTYLARAVDEERVPREALDGLVSGISGAEGAMPTVADRWIEEGRQEGRQEGLREGALAVAQAILEARLGHLPQAVAARMQTLSLAALQQLAVAQSAFASLADLERWLSQQA